MVEFRDDFHSQQSQPSIGRQTSTSSRRDDVILSRKEEALKRLSEREERLAEFQARKARENATLKATREQQARAKSEYIESIKQRKEERRKETMRKITEKDKRAEGLLKEKERLLMAGRDNAIHMSDKLLRVLERSYINERGRSTQKDFSSGINKHNSDRTLNDILDESETDIGKSKTDIIEKIKANIALKISLSKMINAPLTFVMEQLKQLETKVEELETTVNEKNSEIENLEETVVSWKKKSFCIIISLSLLLHGSGLFGNTRMTKSTGDAAKFLKTLPPYLINCLRST